VGVRGVLSRESLGALILALAIPLLFLGETHQPVLELELGSATVDPTPADAALVAVLIAAVMSLVTHGAWRLSAARIVWIPGVLLFAWLGFQALRPASTGDPSFEDHLVDYGELLTYALLAVAVPLIVRRAQDLAIVVAGIVLWSLAATGVALAQLLGADILDAGVTGGRQPSFLTVHDLAALSALSAGIAAAGILATRRRIPAPALFPIAIVAGGLGLVIAGSMVAIAGFAVGAILAIVVARGRLAPAGPRGPSLFALAAFIVIVAVGASAVRAGWVERALDGSDAATEEVAPGPQPEVMTYIAFRVFQDNPLLGVGWLRAGNFEFLEPHVDDARKRFSDEPEASFPFQDVAIPSMYAQLLAEAGVIGLALLIALGVGGLVLCWRTASYASVPWAAGAGLAMLCALPALAGEWALVALVPGTPIQAATALALGLAAAGAATVEDESGG